MNNKKALDVVVVGFALFSMFFGSGNLLFPPYLGLVSGTNWIVSRSGFILTDIILALVVVMAAVKFAGTKVDRGVRTSKVSAWGFPEQKNIVGISMFTKQEFIF